MKKNTRVREIKKNIISLLRVATCLKKKKNWTKPVHLALWEVVVTYSIDSGRVVTI